MRPILTLTKKLIFFSKKKKARFKRQEKKKPTNFGKEIMSAIEIPIIMRVKL